MYDIGDNYIFEIHRWGDEEDRDNGLTALLRASNLPGFDIFSQPSPETCARVLRAAIVAYTPRGD